MNLAFHDKMAESADLLPLLDFLVSTESIPHERMASIRSYRNLWMNYLHDFHDRSYFFSSSQIFPLEHFFSGWKIVIYFIVGSAAAFVSGGKVPTGLLYLPEAAGLIHYTEEGDNPSGPASPAFPVIAVPMPSTDQSGRFHMYEIIDGNHRVSSALMHHESLCVTVLDAPFLPKPLFYSEANWALYHILTGFYALANAWTEPSEYLRDLSERTSS